LDKIDRIRQVLNLEEYHKKKKRAFWIWILRVIGSIALIGGSIYFYLNYVIWVNGMVERVVNKDP